MSQIINDIGDVWNFIGYLETEESDREVNEETQIKYTYPRLWYFQHTGKELNEESFPLIALKESGFVCHARDYIEKLRNASLRILDEIKIPDSRYKELIIDFVNAPKLPVILSGR